MRIVMAALLLSSCTMMTDLDVQHCDTDADCSEGRICSANQVCLLSSSAPECTLDDPCPQGELCSAGKCEPEETVRWACVENEPQTPFRGSDEVTLRVKLVRAGAQSVPPKGAVKAVACTLPSCDQMQGPFASDATGMIDVVVPRGFEGFLRLSGDGFVDTLYELQGPLNSAPPEPANVAMLSATEISKVAKGASAPVDLNERGAVLFELLDCVGEPAEDVQLRLTDAPTSEVVYLGADLLEDAGASATTNTGLAMALDAPIGEVAFSLSRNMQKQALGARSITTVAGAITYVPHQLGR